MYKLKKFEGI